MLLGACGPAPVIDQVYPARESIIATIVIQSCDTVTPIPAGTWETVIEGRIDDEGAGTIDPISGASIVYTVLHAYFPEFQEGRLNETLSGKFGEFSVPVIVHDTDSILIQVEAQGYLPYEERVSCVDLFGGRRYDIGLISISSASDKPP